MDKDGLISFTAATKTKEGLWLLSMFAGIIMCKILVAAIIIALFVGIKTFGVCFSAVNFKEYLFSIQKTGWVSSLFFDGYAKLNKKEKLEWNNRGFSTLHAILVAISSLYLLTLSDIFNVGPADEILMINRTSTFSDTVMAMSIGYFLSDLAMIIYQFPALGGLVYVLHHGLSMFSIIQSLLSGQAHVYIMMVLFTESTTPFVNMRWYLDTAGKKNSNLYTINGLALFLGWLIARILLFVYLFYHMCTYFDQVKLVYPLGFYSLLAVPPLLTLMNAFWFWKIARGLVKALTKSGHSN